MAFIKIVKNKAYSSRMQTKNRRRREGKTDYYARRRLVFQEKNKYDSKKYRLVVRRTCTKIICQVIYSTISNDKVLCAAESSELKKFGLTAGLTNYAAGYATGLLLARRLLKQVGLAEMYKPNKDVNGEYFNVADKEEDKRPFKALLDLGIARATTGARIFASLKGACDGGINVPHKTKRFAGYKTGKGEIQKDKRGRVIETEKAADNFDAKVLRGRIFGAHVTNYMNKLKKEDPAKYKRQFSKWDKCLEAAKVKTCEDLYKKVHAGIIADPSRKKAAGNKAPTKKVVTPGYARVYADSKGRKWIRHFRMTNEERKKRVTKKFADAMSA